MKNTSDAPAPFAAANGSPSFGLEDSPFVMSLTSIFGVEIYTDDKQAAPWIPFFDRWKMNAYLRRNEKKEND